MITESNAQVKVAFIFIIDGTDNIYIYHQQVQVK